MREPRAGQQAGGYFLVLNRSCADLQNKVARIFDDQTNIAVVLDRRQGGRGMPGIPPGPRPGVLAGGWRAKLRSVEAELPEQAA